MVEYVTRAGLERAAASARQKRILIETASAQTPGTLATFLSHTSSDVALLPEVIAILQDHGASVYVDKRDGSLPPVTSPATASALKRRIRDCRSLVLLASVRSKDSKWIPWELGIADGLKSFERIALLKTVETAGESNWVGREYLGIYPYIAEETSPRTGQIVFNVKDPGGAPSCPLRDWLAR